MLFGDRVRELREKKGLVLRQVAAFLEIDTATMSKIERGDRLAKKEQILQLANILETNAEELYVLWLASKVFEVVKDDEKALPALKVAGNKIKGRKN